MPADRFDLRALKMLALALETRSVTRTAERLGLSQPATSRALAQLRRTLADRLLVRSGSGTTLTPFAERLRPRVADAIAAFEGVFAPARFDPAAADGTVRIASTDYGAAVVVASLCRALARAAPRLTVELVPWSAATIAQIEQGRVDLGLYADSDLPADFYFRRLFRESYSCVMRRGHPALSRLTRDGHVAIRDLLPFRHIVALYPDGRRMLPDELATESGERARRVALRTPYFMAGPLTAAESDDVMCLPSRLAALFAGTAGVAAVPIAGRHGFDYGAIWHRRTQTDARARWLRETLIAACGSKSAGA